MTKIQKWNKTKKFLSCLKALFKTVKGLHQTKSKKQNKFGSKRQSTFAKANAFFSTKQFGFLISIIHGIPLFGVSDLKIIHHIDIGGVSRNFYRQHGSYAFKTMIRYMRMSLCHAFSQASSNSFTKFKKEVKHLKRNVE